MASLVQRRDKHADIHNRVQYLQLFACQRAAPLYRWWYALNIDAKHDLLVSLGVPERPHAPQTRYPDHFHVDELLKIDTAPSITQPPLYATLDGVLRTWAIVSDPLTRWAPRVSDEAVDWLDTLTAICEAIADAYVDATNDDGAAPVLSSDQVRQRIREHWLPPEWDRSKLQRRFFPDEPLTVEASPASRSVTRHRDAQCFAHRLDACRALEQAVALDLCEDDDDRAHVASALALLADSVAWTSHDFLTQREAVAIAQAGDKVYERLASYSGHCRPHQLLFLKALVLLQQKKPVGDCFGDFFKVANDESEMLERTFAEDDERAQNRMASLLVQVARAHIAAGLIQNDAHGAIERVLEMRDWEADIACGWYALRGKRRFTKGDMNALDDLDRALQGLSPDDADYAPCCALAAILLKRSGDGGRGARYLALAKATAVGRPPELFQARTAFGESIENDNAPDGVTRIVGSRVPRVLRTPRGGGLVDATRE